MNETSIRSEWLSDVQVARYLGVKSRDTIWRWSREGRLPAPVKLGPNCTRWKLAQLEAHLEAHSQGVAA